MGNKNTKAEPQKTDEELMRERWMKLAENKAREGNKENIQERKEEPGQVSPVEDKFNIKKQEQINYAVEKKKEVEEIFFEPVKEDKIIISKVEEIEAPITVKEDTLIEKIEKREKIEIPPTSTSISHLEIPKEVKKIDKEHSTIEKVFRISLTPSEKFSHLSLYQAQLLSDNKEEAFRLNDLDEIMMSIISEGGRKNNIIVYFLETYHRAIEMIERRFRHEFDDRFDQIRKITASYLALIVYSPENFDLQINKMETMKELSKYYSETDDEEIGFLLNDIISATSADYSFMKEVLSYFFNIIHMDNISSKSNFYNCERIKRNLNVLTKVLNDNPSARLAYVTETNFLPKGINGKTFAVGTYLGIYLNLVSFETEPNILRGNFSSLNQNESDSQLRSHSNKLNNMIQEIYNLIFLLVQYEASREHTLQFFYDLVNSNLERTKMYANPYTTSTIGFLFNSMIILLKLFFENENLGVSNESIFEYIKEIDILYSLSTLNVNFNKFDRVNPTIAREIQTLEEVKQNNKISENKFNLCTKLFFLIHNIMSYFIKNLDDEYVKLSQQIGEMYKMNMMNDPKFREMYSLFRAVEVYLRNPDLMRHVVKFNQVTSVLIFSLNNKKYPYAYGDKEILKVDYRDFVADFNEYIDTSPTSINNLSILPAYIIKNIFNSSLLIRKAYCEGLVSDLELTKIIVYFAIIYSSQVELIQNPHLRSEIFDVLLYFFISNPQERNPKQCAILLKLLSDSFVSNNLIYSLMRVFIDAERLGTSNQFYEKFAIRNKILLLIENIMKSNKSLYSNKILEFANNFRFDCVKMVNLLMNDLTYLIDEVIERLMEIKRYQDLKNDVERFNALDEETKQLENDKFRDNDQRVKPELKVIYFNRK
jgi:hypothetical protein